MAIGIPVLPKTLAKANFTYSDSVLNIKNISAGQRILYIQLIVDSTFNGTSPTASVGITSQVEKFMKTSENDLSGISKYEVNPNYLLSVGTEMVTLYINSNGSTTGNGTLVIGFT